MYEFFLNINNEYQKIDIDTKIVLNNSLADISDIGSVGTIYSYTFDILKTKNNIEKLEYLGINGSDSSIPFQTIACQVTYNGILIIPKGFLVYITTKKEKFEAIINSGNFDFFQNIKNKKLSELNLTDYELWTRPYVIANNWGLMNLNYDWKFSGSQQNINNFRPFLTFKTILNQILSENNLTLESDISFENYNIPLLKDLADDTVRSRAKIYYYESSVNFAENTGTLYGFINLNKIYDYYNLVEEKIAGGTTTSVYICPVNSNLTVKISGTIDQNGSILIYQNSNLIIELTTIEQNEELEITVKKGDEIYLTFAKVNSTISSTVTGLSFEIYDCDFELTAENLDYPIVKNLPDISQLDFFKNILKIFGLFVYINYENSTLELFNFKKVRQNYYSNNIIEINNIFEVKEISYRYGNFANINNFNYKHNTDYSLSSNYGRYQMIIDYLNEEKDYINIDFAPSIDTYFQSRKIAKIKKYTEEEGEIINNNELIDRAMYNESGYYSMTIIDGASNTSTYPYYPRLFFTNLKFENIVPEYWSDFISIMENPTVYKINCTFTFSDFINFDFRKPVKLKDIDGIFFCLKIDDFKAHNQNANLTLLKIQ